MTPVYIPVYRFAVSYSVSFGRRWTILEHMLLLELVSERSSAAMLATRSGLPERLVVEALINLLRAGWIEVRTSREGAYFKSTAIGARRAADETLQSVLQRRINWTSMCLDRLTGSWLRTDDLELTHESDLPDAAFSMKPIVSTFEREDGSLRNLVYLSPDESFEQFEPNLRAPSLFFAKVNFIFGEPELPAYASLSLRGAIKEGAPDHSGPKSTERLPSSTTVSEQARDTLNADDLIVGGSEHFALLKDVLERQASCYVVIHSCFLRERTIIDLLPSLELAAERGLHIDLLWGLNYDPDDLSKTRAVGDARQALERIPNRIRNRVQLSPVSSGSHAKVLLFDENEGSVWHSVIGSCNFLSSEFDWLEMSLHTRSNRIALQLFGRLMAAQVPPSGVWPTVARRLESRWQNIRNLTNKPEEGLHHLELLLDRDHYACVTRARDQAQNQIEIGCDWFGLAAETSVLVPLTRAAELGRKVNLQYCRPTKSLAEEGRGPDVTNLTGRGIMVDLVPQLHGKYLLWDNEALAFTSFNWLSTVVDGTRVRGAEIGILACGPNLRSMFENKQSVVQRGLVAIRQSD